MSHTLEQQRAQDAWDKCQGCTSEYINLAKGLPALIMNSGLMQVMAFLEGKKKQPHTILASQLREWLQNRYPDTIGSKEFAPFMRALMKAEPRVFQQITTEAFAWLRWVRQMAPAASAGGK